jgi:hypothetical protein
MSAISAEQKVNMSLEDLINARKKTMDKTKKAIKPIKTTKVVGGAGKAAVAVEGKAKGRRRAGQRGAGKAAVSVKVAQTVGTAQAKRAAGVAQVRVGDGLCVCVCVGDYGVM